MIQITYCDRKGAGIMKMTGDVEKACAILKRLRTDAVAKDERGNIVGGVYWDVHENGWGWWLDVETPIDTEAETRAQERLEMRPYIEHEVRYGDFYNG